MAKILIVTGLGIAALGVALALFPGVLSWFGRLPGDVRIEGQHSLFFFPITSMIIISLVLTIVLNLFSGR